MAKKIEKYLFDRKEYADATGIDLRKFCVKHKSDRMYGYYSVLDDNLIIGQKATFGGVYLSNHCDPRNFEYLVKKFYEKYLENSVSYSLRLPPSYLSVYFDNFASLLASMHSNVLQETNHFQKIDQQIPSNKFSKTNRKILRRLQAKIFRVTYSQTLNPEGYAVLKQNREARGVQLSLSFSDLKHQSEQICETYHFFECYNQKGVLAAYAVCVKIAKNVLYVLYWGERPDFRSESPVVLLANTILEFCYSNKIEWLDAGVSSVNGVVDQKLAEFKERLGFSQCRKYTIFSKAIR